MRKSKPKHLVLLLILLAVIFSGCGGKKEDPAAKYTLVVTVQPQGAGNVMLDPAGGKYLQGTQVLLYPAANSGYEFVGWEGEHSGNVVAAGDHWKIRMDGNRRITARFAELLPNQVAKPEANPSGGLVAAGTKITLSTATDGATIYYTTDGSIPTSSSTVYDDANKPVVPDGGLTIKAFAVKAGMIDSNVATFSYSTPPPIEDRTVSVGGVSFDMRLAPGGLTFPYGQFEDTATLNYDFWISETEVTYELWYTVFTWAIDAARGSNQYSFQNVGKEGSHGWEGLPPATDKLHPVTSISWRDAIVWCNALTEYYNATYGTNLTCVYAYGGQVLRDSRDTNGTACDQVAMAAGAKGFRLPVTREWEMAARYIDGIEWLPYNHASGDTSGHCYPDVTSTQLGDYVWYKANSDGHSHPVATKQPNHFGLYDMSGNVDELCFEIHDQSETLRVKRGGYFNADTGPSSMFLLVSYQNWVEPQWGFYNVGFRVAATK
jgi:sulfatase modifying factor 1